MSSRGMTALVAASAIVIGGYARLASAQPAQAPRTPTESERQVLLEAFTAARTTFGSAQQADSLPLFQGVIDKVNDTPMYRGDRESRLLAARSHAFRAHVLLNLGRRPEVRTELLALVKLSPAFVMDRVEPPQELLDLWEAAKKANVGYIEFDVPANATVTLDGLSFGRPNTPYPMAFGTYQVLVTEAARTRNLSVTVLAGETVRVTAPPVIDPPKEPPPQKPPPPVQTTPRTPSKPRLFGEVSLPMLLAGVPTTISFDQTIYGRTGSLTLDKQPQLFFGTYQVGAAVRIGDHLGAGFTYTKTERHIDGTLSGTVPSPNSAVLRPVFVEDVDIIEQERDYHLEIRAQFSTKGGAGTLYIGPSFVTIDAGASPSSAHVTVRELGGGQVEVTLTPLPQQQQQIGLNMGFDMAAFPSRFVGVGGGFRYVFTIDQQSGAVGDDSRHSLFATFGLRIRR